MYTLYKFHFLNGISEINQLFDDILIIWPAPVCVYIYIYISFRSSFLVNPARQTFQDRRWTKNELLKLTARFWKIDSSNSGTRGCDAGPSRVTLNLSVLKAYTKSVFMYFTTLQHVILIKWGTFCRIFYPSKVSENLTHCNSGDSRKVAVLENGGTED